MAAAANVPCLSLLSKFPAERAEKYLDCIVSSLCGQQRGPSFHHYSQVWSLTEFWQSCSAWRDFFGRLDPDERLLDVLPATHQAVVRKVTQSRREDIRHQLLHKTDDIGARALTDLDWSVKVCSPLWLGAPQLLGTEGHGLIVGTMRAGVAEYCTREANSCSVGVWQ
nr:uncharacterized protein LOC126540009 isoform X2 [Dermacentor andersoni]